MWDGNYCGPDKPDKGRRGGACNRGVCQAQPANWYNRGSLAFYCEDCARVLNRDPVNQREAQKLFEGLLCVDTLRQTDDMATESDLLELFSMKPDDELTKSVIGVCDGEWRREAADMWRFWRRED